MRTLGFIKKNDYRFFRTKFLFLKITERFVILNFQ